MENSNRIVRDDFPVVRKGYEKEAVDTHLRRIAAAVEKRRPTPGSPLAELAGEKVTGIIEIVEQTASEMVEEADRKAGQVVERAEAEARGHVERAEKSLARLVTDADQLRGTVGELKQRLEGDLEQSVGGLLGPPEAQDEPIDEVIDVIENVAQDVQDDSRGSRGPGARRQAGANGPR